MAWNQKASKQTYAAQYQAFVQDIFFRLDTSATSKVLQQDGSNLDSNLLSDLRMLNFSPSDLADPASVQRAKDLNILHKGFMGATEKLMKVYGTTRVVAHGADKTVDRVKELDSAVAEVQRTLNDESFKQTVAAIQAEDIDSKD